MHSAIDHPQMAQDVPDPRLCLIGDTRIDATAAAKFRGDHGNTGSVCSGVH
jgi:hypothetical protein